MKVTKKGTVVRTFVKNLSLAGALALAFSAATPAEAFSVAVQPLHPHTAKTSLVGVAGACRNPDVDARIAPRHSSRCPQSPQARALRELPE